MSLAISVDDDITGQDIQTTITNGCPRLSQKADDGASGFDAEDVDLRQGQAVARHPDAMHPDLCELEAKLARFFGKRLEIRICKSLFAGRRILNLSSSDPRHLCLLRVRSR